MGKEIKYFVISEICFLLSMAFAIVNVFVELKALDIFWALTLAAGTFFAGCIFGQQNEASDE